MYTHLTEPPRQSFFLLGMRGVGKSTWARAAFPDATYLDLLEERLYQDLLVDPSLFAQSIGHLPPVRPPPDISGRDAPGRRLPCLPANPNTIRREPPRARPRFAAAKPRSGPLGIRVRDRRGPQVPYSDRRARTTPTSRRPDPVSDTSMAGST